MNELHGYTYTPAGPRYGKTLVRGIARFRLEQNLTQTELSEISGMKPGEISKVERFRNPRVADMVSYFSGLGYDIELTLRRQDGTTEVLPLLDLF